MQYGTYKFGDLVFEIEYRYTPEEPMVMYYADGSGYPGSPAEIEIYNIFLGSTEVSEILTESFIDTIELSLYNSHL